jgi:hypothetical protein
MICVSGTIRRWPAVAAGPVVPVFVVDPVLWNRHGANRRAVLVAQTIGR